MLLSKADAARELGIGKRTLDQLIADGKLTPVRIGARVLLEPAELQRFIRASRGAPAPAAEPIGARQRARFHAVSERVDVARKLKPGTTKASLKAWASERFGREIASVNELSYDEASDVLDELRARAVAAGLEND